MSRAATDRKVTLGSSESLAIDCFRNISAIFVLVGHALSFFWVSPLKDQTYFPYIQNIGVLFLFLLSGFLCAHSVSKRVPAKKPWKALAGCMVDRYFRLTTELIVALLFTAVIDLCIVWLGCDYGYKHSYTIPNIMANLLMLVDIPSFGLFTFCALGSARQVWSVSIEFWLFFFIAATNMIGIPMVSRNRKHSAAISCVIAVLLSCALLLLVSKYAGLRMFAACACFALGNVMYAAHQKIRLKKAFTVIGLVASTVAQLSVFVYYKEAYTVLGCLTTLALVFLHCSFVHVWTFASFCLR